MRKKRVVRFCFFVWIAFLLIPTIWAQPKLINLDFKNTEIKDVLRALASEEGASMVVDQDVAGKITVHLSKVRFLDALDVITKNNDLAYSRTGPNVYRVSMADHSFLKVDFGDGMLSVEARNIPVKRLLEEITQKTGANLVPADDLQEKIDVTLQRSPLPDAVKAILAQANCMEEPMGKVSLVRHKTTPALAFTVNYSDRMLTVDAKNIPLNILCRAITEKSGISVVADQSASVNVSIYFQNLNLDDGLRALCETNGLQFFMEGEARRITKKSGSYRVVVKDKQMSVDADNIEISILMAEISRQLKTNITLDREVRGNISAHFQNLPLSQGFMLLTDNNGWMMEKVDNQYCVRVNPNQNKNFRITFNPETELFDLDIETAPLGTIINEMARRANLNIVVPQVSWTVSNTRLHQLKFTDVLDYLFKGSVYSFKYQDGVYMVGDSLYIRPENRDFTETNIYPVTFMKAETLLNSLPQVFSRQNFSLLQDKNALILSAPAAIQQQFADYLSKIDVATIGDRTEVIRVKYLKAEDVLKYFPSSLPKNDVVVLKEANAIVVTGPRNVISQVKNYVEEIDIVNPLIVFDVTVIQISDSDGFTWAAPSGAISLGENKLQIGPSDPTVKVYTPGTSTGVNDTVLASLTALLSKGRGKVLANPTITTLNGCKAEFNVNTKLSYPIVTAKNTDGSTTNSVKEYSTGLKFDIVPWVTVNNQITMEIKPSISDFGSAPAGSSLPSTFERSVDTTVRVDDGETFIIGGLRNTREETTVSKIPILGDIPLLGYLFKSRSVKKTQDEFVMVVTPHLVFDAAEKAKVKEQAEAKMSPAIIESLPDSTKPKAEDVQK